MMEKESQLANYDNRPISKNDEQIATLPTETSLEQLAAILQDKDEYQNLVSQQGELAQSLLDLLQSLSTSPKMSPLRSSILKAVLRLSRKSNLYPQCLTIENVKQLGEHPVASGGFGDIWMGVVEGSQETVCLKVVKLYQSSDVQKVLKDFVREAIVWRQLEHPNLLPFLGLFFLGAGKQRLCLISPWMPNGNLVQYLGRTPRENVDHRQLVWDVASGLHYLHKMKIIHADLKGVNILITESGRAALADFGLSYVAEGELSRMTSSSAFLGGTPRWLAPELLSLESRPSYASDIYAFGCVCYEIYTGLRPFHEFRSDAAVILEIIKGNRPSRPGNLPDLDDTMWSLIRQCWTAEASSRPDIDGVRELLYSLFGTFPLTPAWNLVISDHIWRNIQRVDMPSNGRQVAVFLSRSYDKLRARMRREPIKDTGEERQTEVTKTIDYLTVTGREDWRLILDVCGRASSDEVLAREAVRALSRQFTSGKPVAQLHASRLWAMMLCNSSEVFITQSTSPAFLGVLEALLLSSSTNSAVKVSVLGVLSNCAERGTAFKCLWRKAKIHDRPAEMVLTIARFDRQPDEQPFRLARHIPVDQLFRLPSRIILRILGELDLVGVARCMQVCRTLNSLARSSQLYEYKAELRLANLEDGPVDERYDIQSRLQQLRSHQDAWRSFHWTSKYVPKAGRTCSMGLWEIVGGVFCQGKKSDADIGFSFTQLPSKYRNIAMKEWTINGFGFTCDDFTFEPTQDLLVLVRIVMDSEGFTTHFEVQLCSLAKGGPHPWAAYTTCNVRCLQEGARAGRWTFEMQVYGDQFGILCQSKENVFSQLAILNWRTGKYRLRPSITVDSFAFLSRRILAYTTDYEHTYHEEIPIPFLVIIDLDHVYRKDKCWLLHLRLPIPDHFDGNSFASVHTSYPSQRLLPLPQAQIPFHTPYYDRLVAIPISLDTLQKREWLLLLASVQGLLLLAERMDYYPPSAREIPWESWGPPNTKVIPVDDFTPQSPFYVNGLRAVLPNNRPGHEGKRFRMYDFNPHAIGSDERRTEKLSLETEYQSMILGSTIRTRLPCRIVDGELPEAFEQVLLTEDALVTKSRSGDGTDWKWTFYSF